MDYHACCMHRRICSFQKVAFHQRGYHIGHFGTGVAWQPRRGDTTLQFGSIWIVSLYMLQNATVDITINNRHAFPEPLYSSKVVSCRRPHGRGVHMDPSSSGCSQAVALLRPFWGFGSSGHNLDRWRVLSYLLWHKTASRWRFVQPIWILPFVEDWTSVSWFLNILTRKVTHWSNMVNIQSFCF